MRETILAFGRLSVNNQYTIDQLNKLPYVEERKTGTNSLKAD